MIIDSNIGKFDFNRAKVRLNGEVLDKFSLIQRMVDLDFKRYYYRLMYAMDTYTYVELRSELYDYLTGDYA